MSDSHPLDPSTADDPTTSEARADDPFIVPAIVFSNDFDNLKVIERWAYKFMTDSNQPSRCRLFIPHKNLHSLDATASQDNWLAIERWARSVIMGICAAAAFSPSCHLFIPYKTVLGDLHRGTIDLATAQEREFDNYKTVENWANRLAREEC